MANFRQMHHPAAGPLISDLILSQYFLSLPDIWLDNIVCKSQFWRQLIWIHESSISSQYKADHAASLITLSHHHRGAVSLDPWMSLLVLEIGNRQFIYSYQWFSAESSAIFPLYAKICYHLLISMPCDFSRFMIPLCSCNCVVTAVLDTSCST